MNIETTYNEGGNHEATATATIDGVDYCCTCCGLSGCGEAHFEDNFSNQLSEEQREELRDAAYEVVKAKWDYDGSSWSEPVDEPDDETADEPDDYHQFAIVRTAFHGGGVRCYAVSEESAEGWIELFKAGNSCTCGCYGVWPVADLDSLPNNDTRDPYALAL